MKKESELNAVETFAMFGIACAAGAVAVGLALKKLTTTKVFNYGHQSTREEIMEFVK
jgi:NADH:ubiquinone oxidoreductase subunit K